ncbi:insulin-like growth factor-binding protein complex acid labile subunit [Copidosoma floridanum]|uniref:insulin-like growth factor-binding protein complex acid labile subunit n=1 Tax=Copidosoma floridanum TaxID=29053 RepID=UPI0006C9555C|nr:insulin-like growth factor-binding protein complex acid labile subunit [Copidosoma floridanum]
MGSGRYYPVLAVLWLTFHGSTELAILICPEGCRCDYAVNVPRVNCSYAGLKTLPSNIDNLVEHLDLSNNLLTGLPAVINRLTKLQRLSLARNRFTSLPVNLRGLVNLRELDLSGNEIGSTDDLIGLEDLASLETLHLSGNPLDKLDGLTNPSLRSLKATLCDITKLGDTSLEGLPELVRLNLMGNPLRDIAKPSSAKLQSLDLSRCHLNVLPEDAFVGLPELLELRLSDNPSLVYCTRSKCLRHEKLKKLDVSRCNLDRPGLQRLPSLTHAKLSGNSISMLPDRVFSNRKLTHLFLDSNRLEYLNKSVLVNLPALEVLDLSASGLKHVPTGAFVKNPRLQFLNLSGNWLTDFPKLGASIARLDLSDNSIGKMDNDSLEGMPRLRRLDLSANNLERMPQNLVSDSLMDWGLGENRIRTLDNVSFTGLPNLERLDLSSNLLVQGLHPGLFYKNALLKKLHLHGNPWSCDCQELRPLHHFLTVLGCNEEPLVCASPSQVSGYSWEHACENAWTNKPGITAQSKQTFKLFLLGLLVIIVCFGTVVSIRHRIKTKRQTRDHLRRIHVAEARERLRFLQRRNQWLDEELQGSTSEPRIHPLEVLGPPSYEEAVTMTRLARSLDALDSVSENRQIAGSSESLRANKKRRPRRTARRTRSQSDGNLAREMRRKERLRRALEAKDGTRVEGRPGPRPLTPAAARRRSRRLSVTHNCSPTDDEDSDVTENSGGKKKSGKCPASVRNSNRELGRDGYDGDGTDTES